MGHFIYKQRKKIFIAPFLFKKKVIDHLFFKGWGYGNANLEPRFVGIKVRDLKIYQYILQYTEKILILM